MKDLYASTENNNWRYFDIDHDIQKDNVNCGEFVKQFIECLQNGRDLVKLTPPNLYCKYLQNLLLNHSDPLQNDCPYCPHYCTEIGSECLQCKRFICKNAVTSHL